MEPKNSAMLMDQKIFEIGLPVEVVSVYLLCTGLADSDKALTFETISSLWNGSEEELLKGFAELSKRNILKTDKENNVREIFSSDMWLL